jgi:hypothetical protein
MLLRTGCEKHMEGNIAARCDGYPGSTLAQISRICDLSGRLHRAKSAASRRNVSMVHARDMATGRIPWRAAASFALALHEITLCAARRTHRRRTLPGTWHGWVRRWGLLRGTDSRTARRSPML